MFESFHDTDSVPERWKIWAMLTRSDAGLPSRASSTLGTQLIVNSGPSAAEPTCCGMTSGPPSTIVDVEPVGLVEALLVGREVAGELGLRRPLQLEPDRRQRGRAARRRARPMPRADGAADGADGADAAPPPLEQAANSMPALDHVRRPPRIAASVAPPPTSDSAPAGRAVAVAAPTAPWLAREACHGMTTRSMATIARYSTIPVDGRR